jgi:hypothetical protein
LKLFTNIPDLGNTLKDKIDSIFKKEDLNILAYSTKFIQRSTSLLKPDDFLQLMTSASIEPHVVPLEGLCDKLRSYERKVDIAAQSLMERINRKEASDYLEKVLNNTIGSGLKLIVDKVPAELLKTFNNIYLEDSTECELNEALKEDFKGTGGSASKSMVKINLLYEVHRRAIQDIRVTDRRMPDQELGKRVFEFIKKDDLIVRDLGYFCAEALKTIILYKAYFLSRLPATVKVYLNKDDTNPIDLAKHFNTYFENESMIDLHVFITAQKISVRLIAYRAPKEVAEKRRRLSNKNGKKRGRTASESTKNRLDFSIFITNVPSSIWKAEIIGTIYSLRWQVELIFKEWKSSLKIHYVKGTCQHRVRCLLYGRLIVIVIIHMIYSVLDWYAESTLKKEISLHKLVNWLLRDSRLAQIILKGFKKITISTLINEIGKNKRGCLLKQKRKRLTTKEHIKEATPYWELYQKFEDEGLNVV